MIAKAYNWGLKGGIYPRGVIMILFQKFTKALGVSCMHAYAPNIPKNHRDRPTNTGVIIANTYNWGLKGGYLPPYGG